MRSLNGITVVEHSFQKRGHAVINRAGYARGRDKKNANERLGCGCNID